jgi:hypothetical protein
MEPASVKMILFVFYEISAWKLGAVAVSLDDLDGLRLKMFVLFRRSSKQEGAGERGFSLVDLGDDVGAAQPVSFGDIGG